MANAGGKRRQKKSPPAKGASKGKPRPSSDDDDQKDAQTRDLKSELQELRKEHFVEGDEEEPAPMDEERPRRRCTIA